MNELIKQIRKQKKPPKSASEMRDPFRSCVVDGARRREAIGFEIPVTRGACDRSTSLNCRHGDASLSLDYLNP